MPKISRRETKALLRLNTFIQRVPFPKEGKGLGPNVRFASDMREAGMHRNDVILALVDPDAEWEEVDSLLDAAEAWADKRDEGQWA